MAKEATAINSPSATNIKDAVRKIEGFGTELLSERGSYMNRCQKIRKKIADVKAIAAEQGIPKKELNTLIKKREHIRKIVELRADLEKDERSTFDMLEEKLGDFGLTPLGKAALAKAAAVADAPPPKTGNGENVTALDSMRQ